MFDTNRFRQAEFRQRVKEIEVPLLADFYGTDEKPVWRVRALTHEDVAIMNESQQRNKAMEAVLTAALSASMQDKAEAIKSMMGIGSELPDDTTRRIEALILASIDENGEPFCDRETAVRIATFYPAVLAKITDEIFLLSGQGPEIVGKPNSSTSETK